ncbi:MAG: glycosyltransferase family 4 protein [Solirubrobacteraceae bacterium]
MRIAWTGPVGDGGGVPTMGLLMLRELLRQGVEVDLYLPSYSFEPLPVEPTPGLRIIERRSRWRWGMWYSRTKPSAFFSGAASRTLSNVILNVRLLREHRGRPYDAVYQLSVTELFLLGRFRRLAPPIVVHPCTHAAGELRWHRAEEAYALQSERRTVHMVMRAWLKLRSRVQPRELQRADLVLGLSRRFNELVHEDYGVPLDKLAVVRTPVDLERFTPEGESKPAAKRTLLFISRISTRKGVEQIIELSHRLADRADSVRLLVIGGPTQWSDYTRHLQRLNRNVAEYLGDVRNDELPALLRSATMLLVPSLYEPGSIATAEALACGLPVVLSDEVGNAEAVSGPHARIHRAGDFDGFEQAVRSLLEAEAADRPALRAAARANAEAAFAPSTVIKQLIAVFPAGRTEIKTAQAAASARAPIASPEPSPAAQSRVLATNVKQLGVQGFRRTALAPSLTATLLRRAV